MHDGSPVKRRRTYSFEPLLGQDGFGLLELLLDGS